MAITNRNGHGVTTALPSNADAVTVSPVSLPTQLPPSNQAGSGAAQVARDTAGSYPPAKVSSPNVGGKAGSGSSVKKGVY
jgi:hypothetical protein